MAENLFGDALMRAETRDLQPVELLIAADKLNAAGRSDLAGELYRSWIAHNPDDQLLHAMCFNYAVVLANGNDLPAARAALETAIALKPDFIPSQINLGFLLERLGARGDAISQWLHVIEQLHGINGESLTHKLAALKQVGRVLEGAQFDPNAEEVLRSSLDISPGQRDVLQHWLSLRQRQCKWPLVQPWGTVDRSELLAGMSPLSLAAYTDDPMLQLANAAAYNQAEIGQPAMSFTGQHSILLAAAPSARIRVGYLSSDLREHAVGYLMSELFELHDARIIEAFVYYCGPASVDATAQRFKRSVEHWRDISDLSDDDAAAMMLGDGIAILVDVNGYTHSARSRLLAMRPAPVIVNWLGFPGTTGSPAHNYIIADPFIVPPENEIFYSEHVLRLPCYQPNDRTRSVSPRTLNRAGAGLPESATVFCCFNGTHKFTSFTWQRWMSILHRVDGSVLWLLDCLESTRLRLIESAAAHGIGPDRLVFAPKMHNADHLARYVLADLFLDTSPYGAHTTASDALWMGVPVLTLAGRSFASRVCGSLVTSAGLPELVCSSAAEYVELAVALAHDPSRLIGLRDRLRVGRETCVLFDMRLLVSRLEQLYVFMWDAARAGLTPRPDLYNLAVYGKIGLTLDADDVETQCVADYAERYRAALRADDSFCFIRNDDRLWTRDARTPVPDALNTLHKAA